MGPDVSSLVSVPAGGSLNLVVGETYVIQLRGGTATQGYNQFEAFINFPNTIFQILDVDTTYSADDSPYVDNPADKLYADACLWDADPNSPTYRSCVGGDFKAGGSNAVTTYTVKILSGGGSSQALNTLLYDFSGSSFHYNADYAVEARIANIIDPATSGISKAFSPNPAPVDAVTTLTITLTNPNAGALDGYTFVDNLPVGLAVAATPNASTSGCGTPTFNPAAGATTLTFADGSVAANGSCVIRVDVTTPSTTGDVTNTTENLFVGTTDTGNFATATLTVDTSPPPGTGLCGSTLAQWTFPSGFSTTAPAPTVNNVATATAAPGPGITPLSSTNSTTTADGTASWGTNGDVTIGPLNTANDEYFEFAIDTTGVSSVTLSFDALYKINNSPTDLAVFYGTTTKTAGTVESSAPIATYTIPTRNVWSTFNPPTVSTGLNATGLTYFRIYTFNSGNTNPGSDVNIDNVTFTGCLVAQHPTITKALSPDPVAVGGTSTLTITLSNPNTTALTGAAFTDALPSGVAVAATPAALTTCTGATFAPLAGATTLTFSGGTIPASGSCTVQVDVVATTSGPHLNVTGFLATTESGTNTSSTGAATLTALQPPTIDKQFTDSPILPNGVSTLVFTITNPNQNDAIAGVAFADTFPVAPGAMTVATVPNASTTGCGAPTFSPSAGAGSISFSGGSIAAGASCTVTVEVTAP
ncbi:MAG: hypothetical protein ACRD2J_12910, partial [Thermoanaerobaculia bacterium]